jgi:hypothetical protein
MDAFECNSILNIFLYLYTFLKFMEHWNIKESILLQKLKNPESIQEFLDSMPYDAIDHETNKSPRYSIKEFRANCFEGALIAAAVMEYHGYKPLIIDMAGTNADDHVIMIYKMHGRWGSIAKSNTATLRSREPVYHNLRELVMSYFDFYVNLKGDKLLRGYTRPIDLRRFDSLNWRTTEENLDITIGNTLTDTRHTNILKKGNEKYLNKAEPIVIAATMLGSNPDGFKHH